MYLGYRLSLPLIDHATFQSIQQLYLGQFFSINDLQVLKVSLYYSSWD